MDRERYNEKQKMKRKRKYLTTGKKERSRSEGMDKKLIRGKERESHGEEFSPFTLESFNIPESIKRDRRRIAESGVRSKEVVVSDEESGKREGAIFRFEAVNGSCMEFISAVQTFDKLFKRPVIFGYGIEILEADNFFMDERRRMGLVDKMDTGRIRGITVGD